MNRVSDDQEIVIVKRRDRPAVAMIAADELSALMETAHLLRSPANAKRLLEALNRSQQPSGAAAKTIGQLRREVGYDEAT
ncbi:MAG: type II toxin-antitoxin system Phd/YefM family antitoxin [Lautropia sp.]|nr:type II toxin-antitoxin system Phd/YefM family antitoxin [Lautropia sp.]